MNKDKAMQMLKAKLYLLKQQENAEKAFRNPRRSQGDRLGKPDPFLCACSRIPWSKTTVQDAETGNVDAVLDGDIDLFINAYLKWVTLGESSGEAIPTCRIKGAVSKNADKEVCIWELLKQQ